MSEEEGASPAELLLESSRRNNTTLFTTLHSTLIPTQLSTLINSATDGVGQTALHLAALHGSYDILDSLLDIEGVEVDPVDRFDRATPLHKAVKYSNGDEKGGVMIVEMLVDAGADVALRDKEGRTARDLVEEGGEGGRKVREVLRKAEAEAFLGEEIERKRKEEEEGPTGSASDSE